jgi:AcrR family transcriptional regulator
MTPRPDVSEERKRQILEAATRVFARLGFNKATMDDIVAESGLSKGALYWYFKSKDEIIIAILDGFFNEELGALQAMDSLEGSAKDILMEFTERTVADIQAMMSLMPILFDFYALALRQMEVQTIFGNYLRNYIDVLAPIIQRGVDQREFRPVDAQETAIAMAAIFEGTILLWGYDPEIIDLPRHMKSSIHLLLEGLEI